MGLRTKVTKKGIDYEKAKNEKNLLDRIQAKKPKRGGLLTSYSIPRQRRQKLDTLTQRVRGQRNFLFVEQVFQHPRQ